MSEEFLSPEELSKKLGSFKEKWFSIAEKSEALSNYKSGFNADFVKAIADIYQRVEPCREDIEFFSLSVEHHIPESRGELKELTRSIISGLNNFKNTLQQDIETLEDYNSLRPKLIRLERELTEVQERYEMVSEQAKQAHDEYTDTKKAHADEVQKIKDATDKILDRIQKKFVSDFSEIFEGFHLVTKDDAKKIDYLTLFASLIKDADFVEKIGIKPKGLGGLIGEKKSELEVRKVLLKYKIQDINKEIRPVLEDEKKKLAKIESEIVRIEELEKTAQKLDEDKGEIEQEKEGVKEKIDNLRSKGEEAVGKFTDYEDILDLRESYLQTFNDINIERRKLFKIIDNALKTYEPPEPDIEKRELKEENRDLTSEIKKQAHMNVELKKELRDITKKYKSTHTKLVKKSEEIGGLVASINEQETKINGLEDETAEIKDKLNATSKKLALSQKKLEDAEKKIDTYRLSIENEKERRTRLEKENARLGPELQKTIRKLDKAVEEHEKLEAGVKKSEKEIKEQRAAYASLKTRYKEKVRELKVLRSSTGKPLKAGKRPTPQPHEKKEEERIVSDKIDALRKREGA